MLGFRAGAARGATHIARRQHRPVIRAAARAPVRARRAMRVQAIFGLFPSAPTSSKAAELTEELLSLVSSPRPPAEEVDKLVKSLAPLGIKTPVRSKLLFGEYELVYAAQPGLATRQVLSEPDEIRDISQTKSLGLLASTSTLVGTLGGVDNNTYEEEFGKVEIKSPLGSETKPADVYRQVRIVYLDAALRIVRVITEQGAEGTLAIYKRVLPDDDEEDEDDEPAPRRGGTGIAFFGSPPREGSATIAEREVRKKMAAEEAKAKPRSPSISLPSISPPSGAARGGTAAGRGGSAPPPSISKNLEAEARAKEVAAAKERSAAIKALVDDLTSELKEAQADAREAAKQAKDLERANAAVLKQVANARLQLRSASEEVEAVAADIAKASQNKAAAEAALKEALAGLAAAQAELKSLTKK